jgi:enoyl-CoA hydratase/carnithine racemase
MGLCAVSDVVVATAEASFGFTETRLGILPAVIGPYAIAKIGEGQARALFLPGSRFDAARAERIGLVHEIVPDEDALDARVGELIEELTAAGPTAVGEGAHPAASRPAGGAGAGAHRGRHRATADERRGPGRPVRVPGKARPVVEVAARLTRDPAATIATCATS